MANTDIDSIESHRLPTHTFLATKLNLGDNITKHKHYVDSF
jgi:hypothetical protein